MILADTSVWIDFLNGANSRARHILRGLIEEGEDVSITGIIFTEILQGIKKDRDYKKVRDYIMEFPVYRPKGTETYMKAAEIYRVCRKKGKTVKKPVDCIIASVCVENNLVLLHKDNDFRLIEECAGLKCYKV